jgi:hypothetical protein
MCANNFNAVSQRNNASLPGSLAAAMSRGTPDLRCRRFSLAA